MRLLKRLAAIVTLAATLCCAPPDAIGDTGAATLAALSAMRTKSLPGASGLTWVASVGDYFRLQSGTTLTTDGITIVSASDGTHQWVRTFTPNPAWCSHQSFWSLSPATGNDENAGWGASMAAADAHPLASLAEFIRRMKGCRLGDILAVHILDDDTENVYIDGFFPTSSTNVDSGQEGTLMFLGKPTVIGSGTLSAVVAQSGNTRGTVTDSGLTSSWTAGCTSAADHAGCISTKLRGRMIRNTGGTKHAWMLADLGSKTAQIATPTDTFEGIDQQTSCVRSEFIVGDQYEIITFPRLAYLRIAPNIYTRVQTLTIGGDGIISTAVRPPLGSQILAALTWFTFTSSLGGSISELNCGNSGMTFTGSPLFTNSTFFDDRTGGAYFNGAEVTVGGFNTVYKSFLQFMSRATMTNTENGADSEFGFWDCQDSAITLEFNADIRLDVLSGSGNLGSILNFYNEGTRACAVSSPFTSWTATGSGKPVQFGSAVKYDYNELPVRDDSLGKVVCGVPTF